MIKTTLALLIALAGSARAVGFVDLVAPEISVNISTGGAETPYFAPDKTFGSSVTAAAAIQAGSSMTASAFFGDGSHLTGIGGGSDPTKLPLAGGTETGPVSFTLNSTSGTTPAVNVTSSDRDGIIASLIGPTGRAAGGVQGAFVLIGSTDAAAHSLPYGLILDGSARSAWPAGATFSMLYFPGASETNISPVAATGGLLSMGDIGTVQLQSANAQPLVLSGDNAVSVVTVAGAVDLSAVPGTGGELTLAAAGGATLQSKSAQNLTVQSDNILQLTSGSGQAVNVSGSGQVNVASNNSGTINIDSAGSLSQTSVGAASITAGDTLTVASGGSNKNVTVNSTGGITLHMAVGPLKLTGSIPPTGTLLCINSAGALSTCSVAPVGITCTCP